MPSSGPRTVQITEPRLALCEGESDRNFLQRLLQHYQVPGYQVLCPTRETAQGEGFSALERLITALGVNDLFEQVRAVAVVVDADSVPQDRFRSVQRWLRALGASVAAPYEIATGPPAAAVYLMPGPDETGCLESVLWRATVTAAPEKAQCVEAFLACMRVGPSQGENRHAKARVQSLIVGCCEEPQSSLTHVWSKRGNPLPVESVSYLPLVDLFRAL